MLSNLNVELLANVAPLLRIAEFHTRQSVAAGVVDVV
jgi:hypothetical protein